MQVGHLALQQGQPAVDHLDQQPYLGRLRMRVIKAQVFGDVAQRKAEPLAAQDQDQPRAIAAAKDAGAADALGRQQPLALVKADGARRDAELAGEVGNGEKVAAILLRPVHSSSLSPPRIPRAALSCSICRSASWAAGP